VNLIRVKPNGKYSLEEQGKEFDRLLDEAKRIGKGAREQARQLDGGTEQRTEHQVGASGGKK
jgi:hypothetical protein